MSNRKKANLGVQLDYIIPLEVGCDQESYTADKAGPLTR